MICNQRLAGRRFRWSFCALAVASVFPASAQTISQNLYTNGAFVYLDQNTGTGPVVDVTNGVQLGVANHPVDVTVSSPGVSINGDLILGNTVSNSSTIFRVNDTRNTVAGQFGTEGQRLLFTLSPNVTPQSSAAASNLDVKDGVGSGKITTQSMYMGGTETFGVNLTGSLKDGAKYHLIESNTPISIQNATGTPPSFSDVTSLGTSNCQVCRVTDNSYVMTSRLYVESDSGGSLRYVTYEVSRAADVYIQASNTAGHFSNNAALTLGTIARNGYQLGDLVTAINKIDLDGYGYGDTMSHLAVQVKRLAPIANNSYVRSAFTVSDHMTDIVDDRLNSLRRDVPGKVQELGDRFWMQPLTHTAKQSGVDDYDGYKLYTSGVMLGYDQVADGAAMGAAVSTASSSLDQLAFRQGDSSSIQSFGANLYASRELGAYYIDGMLGAGKHTYAGTRQTAIDRVAGDSFSMTERSIKLGMGYRIRLQTPRSSLVPYFSVMDTQLTQAAYTETSAGDLGLSYESKTFRRSQSQAGLRYNTEGSLGNTPVFTTMHIAWGWDTGLSNLNVQAHYSGPTSTDYTGFETPAAALNRNLIHLGIGSTFGWSAVTRLQIRFDMEHRRGYNSAGAQANAIWMF